uniref:Uncharacterized protein n=1 Tax=Timema cristinae TaxID=61476 RepID=A0A7R9CB85_TIMCR|nr:unnamed protein product [Timema cristinae]
MPNDRLQAVAEDSESKKCEKKEVSGPPLQTASMSVRALIEEKIIQKRITNPHLAVSHAQTTHQITYATADASGRSGAPLHYSVQSPGGSVPGKDPPDLNIKLSSFVVPAPPPQAEKTTRRHSDSEHFVSPRLPSGGGTTTEQEAVALAELLLKRSSGASKVAVKRASSDPGSHQNSNPNSASPSPQPQQQLQLSFQGSETYSLAGVGVSYQTDDGGYFSPSIQDDVFQQSVQDTMLLNGMDPAQLAETIQFQAASLLQDQTTAEQLQDIASLEDYQNATGMQDSVHSPGVGQYQSHSNHSIHQDFQAVLNSPLPVNLVDFSAYGQQSPIPKDLSYQPTHSPLDQKEFINYTNSPHTVLTNSPLPSPLAHHDSPSFTYPTPPASQEGQSPSFGHGGMITSNTGCGLPLSSPQQGSTDSFVQSVISHGGHVPPVSSPLSAAFYTTNMSSSAAVEEALSEVLPAESMSGQGCMRSHGLGLYQSLVNPSPPPHSPLSATPVPSPLSISSVPASSSSVSSPLPSSYAQTQGQISFPLSPHHTLQSQMMPNSEDPLLSSSPKDFCSRKKFDFGGIHSFKLLGNGMVDFGMANSGLTGIMVDSNGELKFFQAANSHPAKNMMVSGSVSTNISSASATSPIRVARKRSRPEPLYILPHPVPSYRSRLRAPRLQEPGSSSPPPQYTPPPMLSPARQGQGLFWQAINVPHSASLSPATWPSSTTVSRNGTIESCGQEESSMPTETAPESDATPHINLGPDFQCVIPQWNPDREKANREPSYEHLLWDPGISKVSTDAEVDMYLEFACCAAVPGGGRNKEYALHLLHMCHGNIHEAMLKLMQPTPFLPSGHPLLAYDYCESDRWSADEMDSFHQGLLKHDKDFLSIAHEANDVELVSTSSETRLFVCEYPDCSASFNSRAALNGHIRIHGGGVCGRSPTPDKRPATATPPALGDLLEEFPCKICGKVFNKVKSRSAHMKSHRPPDAEPKKPKLDPHKMEAAEQTLGRAMCVSSTIGGGGGRHP